MTRFLAASLLAATALLTSAAQSPCTGAPLIGIVLDPTLALIPGATLSLDHSTQKSNDAGRFRFPCVAPGPHQLSITAPGFSAQQLTVTTPHPADLKLTLQPAEVQTQLNVVSNDTAASNSPTAAGPQQTIAGKQLQTLADDPDDLLLELQQLASAAGGAAANAVVAVDGFDGAEGNTHLPPKSSIAYIKVNPDLFSSEYRNPPFGGGRIEVYTKPGLPAFHGALFGTNSSPWMNAHDPFSLGGTSAVGRQRYGFELTGPIRRRGSDFTTTLEHRYINNEAVVNAINVNAAGVETPIVQTVPTPQHLWVGLARVDWQLGPKNTFVASVDTYNNDTDNLGVGGTALLSTGYERRNYDQNLHFTDITTVSPKIEHEARFGVEFDGYTYTPNSTDPQVNVAGAFTSGGASEGNFQEHEIQSTIIDDAIIQAGNHLIKVGIQPELVSIHQRATTNFNGNYNFGGATIPGTNAPITGVQQYINALNGSANGAPTAYNNVAGDPSIHVLQFRNALFYQDDWKVRPNLHFAYGVRYYAQTDPTVVSGLTPRFGVSWALDKKATLSLHAHAGLFTARNTAHSWATLLQMDGVQRVTSTVYSPACPGVFNPATCNPLTNGTPIHSVRTIIPNFPNLFFNIENVGFAKTFPKGWTLSGDYYIGQMWHYARTENINSPTNNQPTGPRPLGANLDILQEQGTGRGYANVEFMGLSNQSLKRIQFTAGAVRVAVVDDTDDSPFFTPQTTGVNAGEYARRDGNGLWNVFANATLNLPEKFVLSANYNGTGGVPYNILTGFDNNGDGDFNDRPQYAPAGTPLCSPNPNPSPNPPLCGYATPWGELISSGGIGSLPRNKGQLPWNHFLDTNFQRVITLTRNPKAEHQQTLTANIRSTNVLNHTNVSAIGNVLGSPNFGIPYTANKGRQIEIGLRYSF
jgi:hypothetical protein